VTSPAVGSAEPILLAVAACLPVLVARPTSPLSGIVKTLPSPPAGSIPLFTLFSSFRI
jgi:hypothetical protein